jgi:hypothetical protein
MKRQFIYRITFISILVLALSSNAINSEGIPQQISYQGKLKENGIPVHNAFRKITFSIAYDNKEWKETHEQVKIMNGLYSVVLGSINKIPLNLFNNQERKLKIAVNDILLEPDIVILSVGYAFRSANSDNANLLNGKTPAYYLNLDTINQIQGDANRNIDLVAGKGIAITKDQTKHSVYIASTVKESTSVLDSPDGKKINVVHVTNSGNVGVGVQSPAEKLDVSGGIRVRNSNGTNAGTIRWNGSDFEGYNGSKWMSLSQINFNPSKGIQIGSSSTCNTNFDGMMRYNTQLKIPEFCNGTTWLALYAQPPEKPDEITGPSSAQYSQSISFSIVPVKRAISYAWSLPDGSKILSGNDSSNITVKYGYKSGEVCVKAINAVGVTSESCHSVDLEQTVYHYTGEEQTFQVPPTVSSINVDVRGAQGGPTQSSNLNVGGLGGRVYATLKVKPDEILYIYVGGAGDYVYKNGGFNGGGQIICNTSQNCNTSIGSGGGASDIRQNGKELTDRVVIAGGGGGGSYGHSEAPCYGGNGGELIGAKGSCLRNDFTYDCIGGGQNGGGLGCSAIYKYNSTTFKYCNYGSFGYGGDALNHSGTRYSGGGGGYYGGGSGLNCGCGGSSYTIPSANNVVHVQGFQKGNGQIIITW